MNKNRLKILYISIGFFSLVASIMWTYRSIKTNTATISYLVDALIIILLVILLLSKNNKSRLAYDHSNYLEWITDGNIENCSKLSVSIKSLEDLVRLAVDLDKRVIHDSKLGKYFVLAEDMTYIHDPSLANFSIENKQQLGRILIERGLLLPEQLETGLYYQKKIGCRLGESLLALGFIDETILYTTLSAQQKVAYYELDSKRDYKDTSWITKLSINKAKALQVLPLGYRSDGKMVLACGDTSKSGVTVALKEIFGEDIYIVSARPSRIYETLDKIDNINKEYSGYTQLLKQRKTEAYERLSEKEWEQFVATYQSGRIDTYLFMKASGLVDPLQLAQVPNKEIIISWLTGKGLINGQIANLIKSFERLSSKQDRDERQSKVIPGIVELLEEAHYITGEEAIWAKKKSEQVGWPIQQILVEDFLVAAETLEYVRAVLDTVKSILNEAKIF